MKTLCLFLLPLISFGQRDLSDRILSYMDAQHAVNQFGGTVIVMKNDSVLFKKAYGLANYEWNVPNSTHTKFGLASVTKYFTAIAVLQLAEKGKLSLDDKLSAYFPEFPEGDSVTLHMLLTHTSGLPLDFEDLYLDHTSISKDSAIKIIEQRPYRFQPGTKCGYSNTGYFLLSVIIEKVSDESYAGYMKTHIFNPAGMTDTGICNNETIIPEMADSYYRAENGLVRNPYINWELCIGLDGIYSTVEDLYKLDRALYSDVLLNESSRQKMNTPYNKNFPDNGFFENYGYGVLVNPYYNHGHYLLTHSGGFFGVMTSFDRFPEDNVFIAVLSNNQSESHWISYGLSALVFGKPVTDPYIHKPISVNATLLKNYTGQYGSVKIVTENNKLYYNSVETELLPEAERKFFRADLNDRTVEFILNKKGKAQSVIITKGGVKEELLRNK